jgi:uncharacterized membrane protein YraQ (UPF0718 family)
MKIKEALKKLDTTLLILLALVLIGVVAAFWIGGGERVISGFTGTGKLIQTIWLRLILGFTMGGLIQVLIPRAVIAKWLGPTSGLKGILIGSYSGIIMALGPPYVSLPIIASIYRAGAGAGPVIALLTGQALLGLQGLIVWQIPFLGVGIPLAKYIVSLFVVPLVGLAGASLFRLITRSPEMADENNQNGYSLGQQDETGETGATSEKE